MNSVEINGSVFASTERVRTETTQAFIGSYGDIQEMVRRWNIQNAIQGKRNRIHICHITPSSATPHEKKLMRKFLSLGMQDDPIYSLESLKLIPIAIDESTQFSSGDEGNTLALFLVEKSANQRTSLVSSLDADFDEYTQRSIKNWDAICTQAGSRE